MPSIDLQLYILDVLHTKSGLYYVLKLCDYVLETGPTLWYLFNKN